MAVIMREDPVTGELSYPDGVDAETSQYAPESGGVPMVDPKGQPSVVPYTHVQQAESLGWRQSSFQESGDIQHENYLQKEYGDNEFESFGEGILRGISFGTSDLILQGLGVSKERLAQVEGRSPYAALGGELTGAIGSAFIPGSPAALLGKMGSGLEEAIAGTKAVSTMAKGGRVARAVARYAPALLKSGAEGAVYGAGGGLSKAALSNDPMTAESLMSDIGSGALLGAETGVVLGFGAKFLGDSVKAAAKYIRGTTEPTIADGVIAAGLSESVAKGELPIAAEVKAAEVRPIPDEVIEDFKSKYHTQDTVSRQQVRQMEGLISKGVEVAPEVQEAAVSLEKARRAVRRFLPLEQERSYESLLKGDLGGSYAKGQGKSMQTWLADNEAISKAVRQPGFRDALLDHQEAIDKMQGLLGNKAYPPIVGEHGIFSGSQPVPANNMLGLRMVVDNAPTAPRVTARPKISDAKLESMFGVTIPKETPIQATAKTGVLADAAKPAGEKFIKAILKKGMGMVVGGGVGHKMGHSVLGAILGHHVLGGITEKLAGMAGKGMSKLAEGVDSFLANPKAIAAARKTTQGILGGVSFAMGHKGEEHTGSAYERRASELEKVVGNPEGARHSIHASLGGVRAADPMLADQMEELAFNRLLFLADKMPKNPGIGVSIGKPIKWHPNDAELSRWARVVEAAEDPTTVIEDMASGTVTKEQVDTMAALYPEMYRRVQTDLVNQAGELQTELSWQQRLTISTLFHVPVDTVLRGSMTTTLQATFEEKPPEQGGKGLGKLPAVKGPTGTPAQKLSVQ